MTTLDLFRSTAPGELERMGPGACILRGFALAGEDGLLSALASIEAEAPFRRINTPGGRPMSVMLTSCGALGWTSDQHGYRYSRVHPDTRRPWPAMPPALRQLACHAADAAGFPGFEPDACLINRYLPGARMSLHQDRDERDLRAPIVSVSLGMSATFLFGGLQRAERTAHVPLHHGDVAVWGGPDRLRYHGIMPLPHHPHPVLGAQRINLTFRKAI
ncbi:DNA oxidative demethylase AlkB [Alcaligenaceae bacterium SJ-26]|nr:DNA oxidative demethylase AlkB [Alcaligenaceae bacterium SJ-26]